MERNSKYDSFINQFAIAFNNVANDVISNLDGVGIHVSKDELLKDLFDGIRREVEKEKVVVNSEPQPFSVKPTLNIDELPELSKNNIMKFMATNNRIKPLIVMEIVQIYMEDGCYFVQIRTIESHFITRRFTESEFIELINKPEEKTEQVESVFGKKKYYNISIS